MNVGGRGLRRIGEGLVSSDVVAGAAIRCGESLRRSAAVRRAQQAAAAAVGDEIAATKVRVAPDHLARFVGTVDTVDILDRTFSRFCVGK